MSEVDETSARFRKRARECRQMAEEVREPDWRNLLLELAQDLEGEADNIQNEQDGS